MTNEELAELERQIERLAQFIMHKIPGEPSQSEGAVDTAIRIMDVQAREAEALRAENARLRGALVAEREENLWSAYATGDVRGDEWTHLYMSDGEWLVRQCGLDPKQGYYKAAEIRDAIPVAARAALKGSQQ